MTNQSTKMHPLLYPRGIRNNNPGNLRLTKQHWQGQKVGGVDTDFIQFDSPLMGLRALMKTLLTYHAKYGLDTAESIINRFAPPAENATDAYIYAVAKRLGVKRRDRLDVANPKTLALLAEAIVRQENGAARPWYTPDLYAAAAALALQQLSGEKA